MRPSVIVALPENCGSSQRPVDRRRQLGAARAADAAGKEPLQNPEVRVAGRPAARCARRCRPTVPPTRSRVSIPSSRSSLTVIWLSIERQPDRRRVVDGVVEQPQLHASRPCRPPCRRSNRASGPTMRIDPLAIAVVYCERLRTNRRTYGSSELSWKRKVISASDCRRERDAAGAGHREPRRRHVDLAADLLAAKRERAGDLADAFLGDEQIVDAEPHVVPRLVEGAAAAGGELREARERRARIRQSGNRVHRNPPAVGVERVGAVPADERRAGDRAAAFRDLDVVEADAAAVEPRATRSPSRTARRRRRPARSSCCRSRAAARYSPVKWNSPDRPPDTG